MGKAGPESGLRYDAGQLLIRIAALSAERREALHRELLAQAESYPDLAGPSRVLLAAVEYVQSLRPLPLRSEGDET